MRMLWLALAFTAIGCGESDLGRAYRAERDLWLAERVAEELSAQRSPSDAAWDALANRFEILARSHLSPVGLSSDAGLKLERIVARAWFRAAEIYAAQLDSGRAERTLQNVVTTLPRLRTVRGEGSLRLGTIAESHGDHAQAIEYFQNTVDLVLPDPEGDKIERDVLALPLRLARLHAKIAGDSLLAGPYEEARTYYESKGASDKLPLRVQSLRFLAEVAADQGRWAEAIEFLDQLEHLLRETDQPMQALAETRFASIRIQIQALTLGEADVDTVQAHLEAMLADYPLDPRAPNSLLLMAYSARDRREPLDALHYVGRIRREFKSSSVLPEAMLLKADLLEATNRWSESLQVLRGLPIEFPTHESALQAHLRIAAHYGQRGDVGAAQTALQQSEDFYRDYLTRFPKGDHTYFAREQLVRTLEEQGRGEEALAELLVLCDQVARTPRGPRAFVAAAQMARWDLRDIPQAISILERTAAEYPDTRIGAWSSRQAQKLLERASP